MIPRLRDAATYQLDAEYLARLWKATGADEPAAALSASQREPVFVYRFDWDEEPTILGTDLPQMLGAAHGFEIRSSSATSISVARAAGSSRTTTRPGGRRCPPR